MKNKLRKLVVRILYRIEIYQKQDDGNYVWRAKYHIRYSTTIIALLILSVPMLFFGGVSGLFRMWKDTFTGKTKENRISGLTQKPNRWFFAQHY